MTSRRHLYPYHINHIGKIYSVKLQFYRKYFERHFRHFAGTSFLKSSEERDDSEATSRKSQSDGLSPKKSILKPSPAKPAANPTTTTTTTTSNARANLMAKDDKKIHFDLNENLELHSEVRNKQWYTRYLN